jgi:hypothetical protein
VALTFLSAFYRNNEGFETDDARIEFARDRIENLKFLYEVAEGDDETVSFRHSLGKINHHYFCRHIVAYFAVISFCRRSQVILHQLRVP